MMRMHVRVLVGKRWIHFYDVGESVLGILKEVCEEGEVLADGRCRGIGSLAGSRWKNKKEGGKKNGRE